MQMEVGAAREKAAQVSAMHREVEMSKKHVRYDKTYYSLKKARELAIQKYGQVRDSVHAWRRWHFVVAK